MGVNCQVRLPVNVRVENVAAVIGVAAGIKPVWSGMDVSDIGWSRVDGVEVKTTSVPDMVNIVFNSRHCYYFFEPDSFDGRLVSMGSTPFWCAVARRLVDFFGGEVDYNDCDSSDIDYKKPKKSRAVNRPTDGEPWKKLHERIMNVPRIHKDELTFDGAGRSSDSYEYNFDDEGFLVIE